MFCETVSFLLFCKLVIHNFLFVYHVLLIILFVYMYHVSSRKCAPLPPIL